VAQKGAASIQAAVLDASKEVSQRASALTSASNQMQAHLEGMEQADAKAAADIGGFASEAAAAVQGGWHVPLQRRAGPGRWAPACLSRAPRCCGCCRQPAPCCSGATLAVSQRLNAPPSPLLLPGFAKSHGQGLAELGSGVARVVAERLVVQPDLAGLPERRDVEVPPTSVISSLRCPPLEEVVQRYHAERSAVLQVGPGRTAARPALAAPQGTGAALAQPAAHALSPAGCRPPPARPPALLQRGGDARQVFDVLTPGKAKRSAAVALPSPTPRQAATPRGGDNEFSRRLDSTTPGHRAKKSKIPAAGAATPSGSRLGLVDRTNLE
jgi:hypothetical protein